MYLAESGWVSRSSLGRGTLSRLSLTLCGWPGAGIWRTCPPWSVGERLEEAEATPILPVIHPPVDSDKCQSWAVPGTRHESDLAPALLPALGEDRLENRQMQPELVVSTEQNGVQRVWFGEEGMLWKEDIN